MFMVAFLETQSPEAKQHYEGVKDGMSSSTPFCDWILTDFYVNVEKIEEPEELAPNAR